MALSFHVTFCCSQGCPAVPQAQSGLLQSRCGSAEVVFPHPLEGYWHLGDPMLLLMTRSPLAPVAVTTPCHVLQPVMLLLHGAPREPGRAVHQVALRDLAKDHGDTYTALLCTVLTCPFLIWVGGRTRNNFSNLHKQNLEFKEILPLTVVTWPGNGAFETRVQVFNSTF